MGDFLAVRSNYSLAMLLRHFVTLLSWHQVALFLGNIHAVLFRHCIAVLSGNQLALLLRHVATLLLGHVVADWLGHILALLLGDVLALLLAHLQCIVTFFYQVLIVVPCDKSRGALSCSGAPREAHKHFSALCGTLSKMQFSLAFKESDVHRTLLMMLQHYF